MALIVHLGEFDARRLYEPAGFDSMFRYCQSVLHLSEDAVYNRIETARAARRHPALIEMLLDGRLSPTTARMLARHLTPENESVFLAAASGKGKTAVEELLANRCPHPDVRPSVRKLPVAPAAAAAAPGPQLSSGPPAASEPPLFMTPPPRSAAVRPLGLERYEVRYTATAAQRERLQAAQDLLGHAVPGGDLAEIVDRGVTLLIEQLRRRKLAATSRPRKGQGRDKRSDSVPAEVRRAVWARDGGRCAFVAAAGRRCDARRRIEFHHVIPRAVGGKATADNIQLRCRAHNGHEVELVFGREKRYRKEDPSRRQAPTATRPGTTSRCECPLPDWARTPISPPPGG